MFNMVHTWAKDHVNNNGNNVQLIHIFTQVVEIQVKLIW